MPGNLPTARLSAHAVARCEEMGIRTKRVKRVVRDPDLRYTTRGCLMVCRYDEPDFRVVVDTSNVVVTVLPWTDEQYERAS